MLLPVWSDLLLQGPDPQFVKILNGSEESASIEEERLRL